jgi:hypothetical protein
MAERGFVLPAAGNYRFAGTDLDGSRVVFGVLYGEYRVGCCRMSDLRMLTERGTIHKGELTVVYDRLALPEMLIAAPVEEVDYYRGKLGGIRALLDERARPPTKSDTVELLKSLGVKGLEPVSNDRLEEARRLYEQFSGLF